MSLRLEISGDVAQLEYDDSMSNLTYLLGPAVLIVFIAFQFEVLRPLGIAGVLIAPFAALAHLSRTAPAHRELRIDRRSNTLRTVSPSGQVREWSVQSFKHIKLLRVLIPRSRSVHQVKLVTSDGTVMIQGYQSKEWALQLASKLADWLNLQVVHAEGKSVFDLASDTQIPH
jgi:hypothetical protein